MLSKTRATTVWTLRHQHGVQRTRAVFEVAMNGMRTWMQTHKNTPEFQGERPSA
jgi:hypothetical protein